MSYNNEFQKIDTPEKAYVLGLYYSDGYVSINPNKRYRSGITVHLDDAQLLKDINEVFPCFKYLKPTKRNVGCLSLDYKKAVYDLHQNGVLIRKSTENKNSLKFPKIHPNLYSHFIRGFFDGDGSICRSKTSSKNAKNFSLTCCNYFLLKKMKEILHYEGILLNFYSRKNKPSTVKGKIANFTQTTFVLYRYGNEAILKKLCSYLYKDATLFMARKKEVFEHWEYKPTLPCPRCGKETDRLEKKRMYCKACNHYSLYNRMYYELDNHNCGHCHSSNTVLNGKSKSRVSKRVTGISVLCRDCNRNTTRRIINRRVTAPLHSNV